MPDTEKTEITPDESLLYAAQKAVADLIYAEMKQNKAAFTEGMLHEREKGNKQKVAELPDGTVVATHTVTQPSRKTDVTSEPEFLNWLMDTHPEYVQEVTTYRIAPEALTKVTESNTLGGDGHWYDADGEQVPGVKTWTPPATSFSTRFTKTGKDEIIDALRNGELAELVERTEGVLKQIGGRP